MEFKPMNNFRLWYFILLLPGLLTGVGASRVSPAESGMLEYTLDPRTQTLELFWKNDKGGNYGNFGNLKKSLEASGKTLVFAMNGGMFNPDGAPVGLYIEQGKMLAPLDTVPAGYGNFYLQPNGVFYLTADREARVCKTSDFRFSSDIRYATQSGPMLVTGGQIHPVFNPVSKNVQIRNGVGILPDGKILFALSKQKINLYEFADFFRKNGCAEALYLDGFVSRAYLASENRLQPGGNFGVMMAETKALNK